MSRRGRGETWFGQTVTASRRYECPRCRTTIRPGERVRWGRVRTDDWMPADLRTPAETHAYEPQRFPKFSSGIPRRNHE